MKRIAYLVSTALLAAAFFVACAPAQASQIYGKVTAPGLSNAAGAVVYVAAIPGKSFAPPTTNPVMDQTHMQFEPHVLPVVVGSTVDFLNSDSVAHNVFTPDACARHFNLGTWTQGQKRSHKFDKLCFATVLCSLHPEMEGYVAVLPTPYFAVTQANGNYRIENVPDGHYALKIWHPKGHAQEQSVDVSGATRVNFELTN